MVSMILDFYTNSSECSWIMLVLFGSMPVSDFCPTQGSGGLLPCPFDSSLDRLPRRRQLFEAPGCQMVRFHVPPPCPPVPQFTSPCWGTGKRTPNSRSLYFGLKSPRAAVEPACTYPSSFYFCNLYIYLQIFLCVILCVCGRGGGRTSGCRDLIMGRSPLNISGTYNIAGRSEWWTF